MKKYAGIDVQEMYPAGSPPKADNWTTGHLPEGGRGLPQGRRSLRHRSRRDHRQRRYRRRDLPVVRRPARRRQGQPHRQDRRGAAGARILQEADRVPAAGRRGLGRRLQQQMAGLRQGRDDHESAERLGGRQARRAAGRRAMLDARLPGRAEGPLCAVPALLLEHLELLQEQGSRQEPAGAPVASRRRSRRWWRRAAATICRRSRS